MTLVLCYNKGCGKKFDPSDNQPDSCTYHPGVPVFHDAYKGWGCCNKKVTDFTEFLNIKGCTKGPHNAEKPVEPEKPKTDESAGKSKTEEKKEIICGAPKPPTFAPRSLANEPLVRIAPMVTQSLQLVLQAKREKDTSEAEQQANGDPIEAEAVPVGTSCKNSGCTANYAGEQSNLESCTFHPGIPIFHEGMKYWSCCQRKTSEFDNFMAQAGCSRGNHAWTKAAAGKQEVSCRYDWHQTGAFLIISIYAKATEPVDSWVEANSVTLKCHVEFDYGMNIFNLEIPLWGAIDVPKSQVTLTGTKVELKLKKSDPISWPRLDYKDDTKTSLVATDIQSS